MKHHERQFGFESRTFRSCQLFFPFPGRGENSFAGNFAQDKSEEKEFSNCDAQFFCCFLLRFFNFNNTQKKNLLLMPPNNKILLFFPQFFLFSYVYKTIGLKRTKWKKFAWFLIGFFFRARRSSFIGALLPSTNLIYYKVRNIFCFSCWKRPPTRICLYPRERPDETSFHISFFHFSFTSFAVSQASWIKIVLLLLRNH